MALPTTPDARVILAHQDLVRQTTDRVVNWATTYWNGMGEWHDAQVAAFIDDVVPVVTAGQRQVCSLTNSYLASLARLNGFEPVEAATLPLEPLRGVALEEVYRRPAVATYSALAQGKPLNEAVRLGSNRLDALIRMDAQMAQVWTARERLKNDERIVGYERVLSGGETCLLCAVASTQRYHREDLMPIHDRCQCSVMPIYGTKDTGQVINEERYKALGDMLSKADEDGVSIRSIEVREHGEYGPVLTWKGHDFTGPDDL